MAPHSSTLAWKIPCMEEPDRLQTRGSLRVRHDWATSLFPFMHWRRKWQPTRVLAWRIPGTGEPGGLLSMGSHRVAHDWSDLAVAADSILKSRDYLVNKGPSNQGYGFSSGHVWVWELDYKESWAQNWCFWTVVLEKTLQSPLDNKEIQPIHPKGDQSWMVIGGTDVEAETPILWPPDVKSWLIGKDPDAGKDWGQEEKGMTGWDGWMASLIG